MQPLPLGAGAGDRQHQTFGPALDDLADDPPVPDRGRRADRDAAQRLRLAAARLEGKVRPRHRRLEGDQDPLAGLDPAAIVGGDHHLGAHPRPGQVHQHPAGPSGAPLDRPHGLDHALPDRGRIVAAVDPGAVHALLREPGHGLDVERELGCQRDHDARLTPFPGRAEQLLGVGVQLTQPRRRARRHRAGAHAVGGGTQGIEGADHGVEIVQHPALAAAERRDAPRLQRRLQGAQVVLAERQVVREIRPARAKSRALDLDRPGAQVVFRLARDLLAQPAHPLEQGPQILAAGFAHGRPRHGRDRAQVAPMPSRRTSRIRRIVTKARQCRRGARTGSLSVPSLAMLAPVSGEGGGPVNRIDLDGRRAVVTGGAQGIGRAIALRLLASGAAVALWDRDQTLVEATAAELAREGRVQAQAVDVTDLVAVERAAAATVAALGGIDILVNNAGIAGPNHPLWDYPPDAWRQVIEIDLNAVFYCCRAVVPQMIGQGYGRIVNVASIAGKEGNPSASAYAAAKAGVIALTKALGKELATKDIAVNCITPAAARTRIFDQITQEFVDYMLSKIPRGRFVEVEEIAAMVAWLVSAENSFTTGAVFDLSGGRATY